MDGSEIGRRIELLAGVGLVAFGGVFALIELAGGGRVWSLAWPLFVIVAGLLLFAGVFSFGRSGGFLAIPGAILAVDGLVLLVTNTFGVWTAWAYAWALVTPGAVGLGLLVHGTLAGIPRLRRAGAVLAGLGLALFAVFGTAFELVAGLSGPFGPAVGRVVWPLLLIVAGVWLIALWARRP